MSKLLTVVTATYNKGDRNKNSIQSILDQTFQDFNYVIVNDGSLDTTEGILNSFEDPRLKIIHQRNQGFVKTLATVMDQIETPYVAIHGAGDISLPTRLEKQLTYLQKHATIGVVACGVHTLTSEAVEKIDIHQLSPKRKKPKNIEYNTVEQMMQKNIIDHGDAMIRMSAYRDVGGYRSFFRYAQDRDLWLRILEKYSILKIGESLYVKVIDPASDISGNPQKSEQQALYSLFSRYISENKEFIKNPKEDDLNKAFDGFLKSIENKNKGKKGEIIGRVFKNTLRNPDCIDEAIEVIDKYSHKHSFIKSLTILKFMSNNIPKGRQIYVFYYIRIRSRISRLKNKTRKLWQVKKTI